MNNSKNINNIQKGKNILQTNYLEDRKIRLMFSESYKTDESEPTLTVYIEEKGESLRCARESFLEKLGTENLAWINKKKDRYSQVIY